MNARMASSSAAAFAGWDSGSVLGLSYSWSLWAGMCVSADSCKDGTLAPWIVVMRLGSLFSFWYKSCCYAVLLHHLLRD